MDIKAITKQTDEICALASQYYPVGDPRPVELTALNKELLSSIDDRQCKVILTQMKEFLSGGMGGFTDVGLILPPGVSYAQVAPQYFKRVTKLYEAIEQLLIANP